MHIFVTLKDVWSLVQNIVEEFRHQQSCSFIFFSGHVHLVLELNIVRLKQFILTLRSLELLLNLLQLMLKEIDQVFVGFVVGHHRGSSTIALPLSLSAHNIWPLLSLLALHVFNLLLQSLDDLLTEMTSLRQFLLDLLVDLDISLKSINLSLHLTILVEKLLSLL